MENIESTLSEWQSSLCQQLDVAALLERNPIAHKWKTTYRSMCIRETVAWRFVDLSTQSLVLYKLEKTLGARILLRSALETLAMLIYLNQLTRKVVLGNLSWSEFSEKTMTLLAGSKDGSTEHQATNTLTVLKKCEAEYPGIEKLYAIMSESAHQNYEGMRTIYSTTDRPNFITYFKNRSNELYAGIHLSSLSSAMTVFDREYNDAWPSAFETLEKWLELNDAHLTEDNFSK